ncbi:Signal transduction protein [Kickxella alabastrina]|uniref:Signal transduction protein n=1 Tax=Kickxella alabastrina TaxID=61397 RepID=A0ACC1IG13_9FUNG|nr:Signal transduction protein [Kickxella alabastrina]
MKFGKYLEAEQVPEWVKMYVDYKGLKRQVKVIAMAIDKRERGPIDEGHSLIRRASAYLGYDSFVLSSPDAVHLNDGSPAPRTIPQASSSAIVPEITIAAEQLPRKDPRSDTECCSRAGCTKCRHFDSIISASPQIAMNMSVGNMGKVATTSMALAHDANIKIPISAQDAFTEGIRQRRTPIASSDCLSDDGFKKELPTRLPEEQEFFEQLEQELEKVNTFYLQKQTLFSTRLDSIRQQQQIYDEMLSGEHEAAALNRRPSRDMSFASLSGKMGAKSSDKTLGKSYRKNSSMTLVRSNSKANNNSNAFGKSFNNPDTKSSPSPKTFEPSAQLRAARSKIKHAMLEVYRGMDLLKNYRILCYTAFIKALKKYQKTAKWCDGTEYFLNRVDACYMSTSNRLNIMSAELETMYVSRYAGGSRSEGMSKLRVTGTGTSHNNQGTIFRCGLMLGTSVPLIVRAIYEATLLENEERVPYHRQLLQIYGAVYLVLVFLLLFSLNIMAWARAHINYRFIFEVDPRDFLDSWQFLELSSVFILLASIVFWVNFTLRIEHNSYICIYALLGTLLGMFFMPVKTFYWSSRWWLMKSLWRILFSGLYSVEFRDFFLGDEMCSLTYTFSMVLMLGCASANNWTNLDESCNTTQWWSNAAFLMMPNMFRLLQCIRRYADSGDAFPHLANGAKYSSTILTIWLASANRIQGGNVWKPIWVASAIANSCFTSLWDLLMDWGLFESRSKHRFLRSELKFDRPWVYYVAIVIDVILRFMWITQISPTFFSFGHKVHSSTISYVAAVFEVLRRFSWNFFRVENEHISNCGQFRATTDIPLPFNFDEDMEQSVDPIHNEFEHEYDALAIGSPMSPQTGLSPGAGSSKWPNV